ncbi:MAG: fused MFS/spermidine synthase [Planctomycetales bacterium]|nr:fused MFS/spermidine synthase [Planctomycetales bacterium]
MVRSRQRVNSQQVNPLTAPLKSRPWPAGYLLATTTFVASFLLFQIQPLIGRLMLPSFGGAAGVWTVCLLFFQTMLFAGYVYAHALTKYLAPRAQATLHSMLALGALAALPISSESNGAFEGNASAATVQSQTPTFELLSVLMRSVGPPFLVLAATAPLIQRWWSLQTNRSPYRLYSLSNAGSLLALLSYTFLAERLVGTSRLTHLWTWGFVAVVCLTMASAIVCQRTVAVREPHADRHASHCSEAITVKRRLSWVILAAMGTIVLMSVSNSLCQDVSSVPLLWIVPLTLYLITYIVCFGQQRIYRSTPAILFMIVSNALTACVYNELLRISFSWFIVLGLLGMLASCFVCHGELEQRKPSPAHLTEYYLYIAGGGALGGLAVGWIAPLVFNDYYELPSSFLCVTIVGLAILFWDAKSPLQRANRLWMWLLLLLLFALQVKGWSGSIVSRNLAALTVQRSFYGVLRTCLTAPAPEIPVDYLGLFSGSTEHGGQYLDDERSQYPTSYYARSTGLGFAFTQLDPAPERHIGVAGLGAGTIAAYGRPRDRFRFYEIDETVVPLAAEVFTYLSQLRNRGGGYEVVLGDARVSLAQESPQQFDLLVLDAFAGDAVPVHLLTREAMTTYLRHVKSTGVIAVHVSNRFLALPLIVRDLAAYHGLALAHITTEADAKQDNLAASDWMLLRRPEGFVNGTVTPPYKRPFHIGSPRVIWTDDRSSVYEILR